MMLLVFNFVSPFCLCDKEAFCSIAFCPLSPSDGSGLGLDHQIVYWITSHTLEFGIRMVRAFKE